MHEASIALSILDIALKRCLEAGYEKIDSIGLRIGKASGVMTEALVFTFDALKHDTPAHRAVLNIENISVGGICLSCKSEFSTEDLYVFSCPRCGGAEIEINSGRELDIVDIEVS
jgi:hydrogenase nickel incorporation protein HypA/HybF